MHFSNLHGQAAGLKFRVLNRVSARPNVLCHVWESCPIVPLYLNGNDTTIFIFHTGRVEDPRSLWVGQHDAKTGRAVCLP